MKTTRENGKARKKAGPLAVRASISFPPDLYAALESIATDKKVSLAWVVRDAAEMYVENEAKDGNKGRRRSTARRAS